MEPLREGTYRLKVDVKNPHPDRRASQDRVTSWESWAVWPAGLVLLVKLRPGEGDGNGRLSPPVAHVVARGGYRDLYPWDDGYSAIAASLESVTEAPSDVLRRRCGSMSGGYALEILDRCGLGTAEVAALLDAIESEERAE